MSTALIISLSCNAGLYILGLIYINLSLDYKPQRWERPSTLLWPIVLVLLAFVACYRTLRKKFKKKPKPVQQREAPPKKY